MLGAGTDFYREALVVKHGDDFEMPTECLDVAAQRGEVDVAATFEARDVALCDAETVGELHLRDTA